MAKKDRLLQWLRDAHAMEMQAETMLSAQAGRIERYPELKQRIEEHVRETQHQAELIEGCIRRCGGVPSATKDMGGKMMAMMQGMGGVFAGDEVVKGAMAGYTFEHFEISAYGVLIATAEECGDHETKRVCEQILAEEQAMAAWLYDHLPKVADQFLVREESEGASAKR